MLVLKKILYLTITSVFFSFLFQFCKYSTEKYKEGKKLYISSCSSCHGENAEGLGKWYPPINNAQLILQNRNNLPLWIRFGIYSDSSHRFKTQLGIADMPEHPHLNNIDICNILNFLNDQFWKQSPYSIQEVNSILKL